MNIHPKNGNYCVVEKGSKCGKLAVVLMDKVLIGSLDHFYCGKPCGFCGYYSFCK